MFKNTFTIFLFLLVLLTACQQSTSLGPAVQKTDPPRTVLAPDEALLVQGRPGDRASIFDRKTGDLMWHLPAGRESANGRAYVAAVPQGETTQLRHYIARQAQPIELFQVDGPAEVSAISASGRWVVLTLNDSDAAPQSKPITTLQVLDLKRDAFSKKFTLQGEFVVEGIDIVGRSIYLIEHLPERGDGNHYQVRVFDAQAGALDRTPIRDKRFLDQVMAGYAWGTATDPDGRWLTTLYVNNLNDTAFIHALNLGNRWALCLSLPSKTDDHEQLKYYGLALTPAGDAVFAVNPLLGTLVEYDLNDTTIMKIRQFEPVESQVTAAHAPDILLTTKVSADGQTVYFAFEQHVWRYDRVSGIISGPFTASEPVVDLALTRDESGLLLAFDTTTLQETAVDAAFGQLASK